MDLRMYFLSSLGTRMMVYPNLTSLSRRCHSWFFRVRNVVLTPTSECRGVLVTRQVAKMCPVFTCSYLKKLLPPRSFCVTVTLKVFRLKLIDSAEVKGCLIEKGVMTEPSSIRKWQEWVSFLSGVCYGWRVRYRRGIKRVPGNLLCPVPSYDKREMRFISRIGTVRGPLRLEVVKSRNLLVCSLILSVAFSSN